MAEPCPCGLQAQVPAAVTTTLRWFPFTESRAGLILCACSAPLEFWLPLRSTALLPAPCSRFVELPPSLLHLLPLPCQLLLIKQTPRLWHTLIQGLTAAAWTRVFTG